MGKWVPKAGLGSFDAIIAPGQGVIHFVVAAKVLAPGVIHSAVAGAVGCPHGRDSCWLKQKTVKRPPLQSQGARQAGRAPCFAGGVPSSMFSVFIFGKFSFSVFAAARAPFYRSAVRIYFDLG